MKLTTTALTIGLALVSTIAQAQPAGQWSRVETLPLGGIVVVTDASGATIRGRVLRADADSMLLYAPTVDTKQLKPIERLARDRAGLLHRVDTVALEMPDSGIRIGAGGITRKAVRIAAFAEVFHVALRSNIVSVVEPKDQRGSVLATVAGVAVGGAAGWFSGLMIGLHDDGRCSPHCAARNISVGTAFIGGPILGGMAGNALGKSKQDLVIYRR